MPSWRPIHCHVKCMFSGSDKGCLVDWQPSPFAATSCPVSWLTVAVSYWLQTVDFFAWSAAGSLCTLRSWIFCASLSFEILLSTRDTHRPDGAVWWVVVCTSLCHWSDEWCERTCPGSRFLVWPCLKENGAFHNSSKCATPKDFHWAERILPFRLLFHASTQNLFGQITNLIFFLSVNEGTYTQCPCKSSLRQGSTFSQERILWKVQVVLLFDWGSLAAWVVKSTWCSQCWDCISTHFDSNSREYFSCLTHHNCRILVPVVMLYMYVLDQCCSFLPLEAQHCLCDLVKHFLFLLSIDL